MGQGDNLSAIVCRKLELEVKFYSGGCVRKLVAPERVSIPAAQDFHAQRPVAGEALNCAETIHAAFFVDAEPAHFHTGADHANGAVNQNAAQIDPQAGFDGYGVIDWNAAHSGVDQLCFGLAAEHEAANIKIVSRMYPALRVVVVGMAESVVGP